MSVSISGDGSVTGIDQGLNVVGVVTATTLNVGTGTSISSPATNVLTLGTNNTEAVRIDSSGNFNLVNTAGIMTAFKYETPALINNHFKSNSTSAGAYVRMYAAAGTGQWDIYNNGANLRFSDNASAGNIQMDRPLVMNSQNIVMSSGNGIDFSATANSSGTMTSELLSDYEEGIWTPTIRLSGGTGNGVTFAPTNSTFRGRYVKIGDMVYLEAYSRHNFSTVGSYTFSSVEIIGLPYASGGQSSQQYSPISIGYLSHFYSGFPTTNNNFPAGYVKSGEAVIVLSINNPNGAETYISNGVLSTNASVGIMFSTYYRASNSG